MNETEDGAAVEVATLFTNACATFVQQRLQYIPQNRQGLLDILLNNDYRNVLATCVNDINVINAFTLAAFDDDVELLQHFHNIGVNVNVKNQYDSTALCDACHFGHEGSVRWLLDHDADVNIRGDCDTTALMCASYAGNTAVVEMLLQKSAALDIQNTDGRTALMFASESYHKEIVQLLLKHNSDTDLKDNEGKTALDLAKNQEIKELLRNHVNTTFVLK